jgi:hypothetical protein
VIVAQLFKAGRLLRWDTTGKNILPRPPVGRRRSSSSHAMSQANGKLEGRMVGRRELGGTIHTEE